jgi:hypothetical protein
LSEAAIQPEGEAAFLIAVDGHVEEDGVEFGSMPGEPVGEGLRCEGWKALGGERDFGCGCRRSGACAEELRFDLVMTFEGGSEIESVVADATDGGGQARQDLENAFQGGRKLVGAR